jgi:glycosyltransferase involved in cell wall biosynthesis
LKPTASRDYVCTLSTPIVAFAKDWHEDPTSNLHVLRELAKSRRVLWLNSIATRTPSLASGRDLGKIRRKLGEFARGPVRVENDLWVATPLALPFPHSPVARALNRRLLRATIRAYRLRLGIRDFQLWTFLPTTADYVGTLGESLAVYYCVDEWSLFGYLERDETVALERALLAKVDAVFATSNQLVESKRALNPHTYLAAHGVDHAKFARALDGLAIPADLAAIPRPRIGFYGTLRSWIDFAMLAEIARRRPAWSLVLIGQQLDDVSALRGLANVHLLGQRGHDELPAYCAGFDVGMIPYVLDNRAATINPLKLREYLSAGVPVVSTPLAEVARFGELVELARNADEFIAAIERLLARDSNGGAAAARARRSAAMQSETWSARAAEVARVVDALPRRQPA